MFLEDTKEKKIEARKLQRKYFFLSDGEELDFREQRLLRRREQHPAARRTGDESVQSRGVVGGRTEFHPDAAETSYDTRYTKILGTLRIVRLS